MTALILYSFTRVLAFMASLATLTTLVALGHSHWAILPAVLAVILGFSCAFDPTSADSEKDPNKPG